MRADLAALASQVRGEIRDLARAISEVQGPLPRILAMTREVRETIGRLHTSQAGTREALEHLERMAASLEVTTDYLVALAEDADDTDDNEGRTTIQSRPSVSMRLPRRRQWPRARARVATLRQPGRGTPTPRMGSRSSSAPKQRGWPGDGLATCTRP